MPMRGALSAPAMRSNWPAEAFASAWNRTLRFFSKQELVAVICFYATGLVILILLVLSFPLPDEPGGVLAQVCGSAVRAGLGSR